MLLFICRVAPEATEALLEELLIPSLEAVRAEGSHITLGELQSKIRRALAEIHSTPAFSPRRRIEKKRTLGQRPRLAYLKLWVSTHVEVAPGARTKAGALFEAYQLDAVINGGATSCRVFSETVAALGIQKKCIRGTNYYAARLKPVATELAA